MKCTLLFIYTLVAFNATAQHNNYHPDTIIDGNTYSYVEKMPQARYSVSDYLSKNIHYPDTALKYNIEGRVLVKFLVNEDGHISDCQVIDSKGGELEEEALRVVRNMPRWKPGIQKGKRIKVWERLPITFKPD